MPNAVVQKLRHAAALSDDDERILDAACGDVREVPARQDLIREGERPSEVHAVLSGFACRYKTTPDGGRQIMGLLAPGDFCDLHIAVLGEMDHSIATLSESRVAFIPRTTVEMLVTTSPALSRALWWATLVDEATLREWLLNMGRRSAEQQVGHLICELLLRLRAVGLAPDDSFEMPLTQIELADTLGMSSVHVNRVTQLLRQHELITWRGRNLRVDDVAGLMALADFDARYLHLKTT